MSASSIIASSVDLRIHDLSDSACLILASSRSECKRIHVTHANKLACTDTADFDLGGMRAGEAYQRFEIIHIPTPCYTGERNVLLGMISRKKARSKLTVIVPVDRETL